MKLMDLKCVNTLRVLGAEIIGKAKSGHPGIVLGAAPIAHTLFTKHLNINIESHYKRRKKALIFFRSLFTDETIISLKTHFFIQYHTLAIKIISNFAYLFTKEHV
jgi:hypothetical protein